MSVAVYCLNKSNYSLNVDIYDELRGATEAGQTGAGARAWCDKATMRQRPPVATHEYDAFLSECLLCASIH